jgi:hypothetical protein
VDERPDQIEDHIRTTQRELGSNLQELEDKVKDATNWRVQFERHPMALLGIAFAGGLLLSAGLGGRRRHTPPYYGPWTPGPHLSGSGLGTPVNDPGLERKEKPSDVWGGIKGALLAAAGTQVSSVLGELLPGFKEHATQASGAAAQSPAPPSGNGVHDEVRPTNRPML